VQAEAAAVIALRRDALLAEAERDVADFARLVRAWPALVAAARGVPLDTPAARPRASPEPHPARAPAARSQWPTSQP
jgi:hypothetical protein